MKLPFTLGTGADENADPVDKLPVNFLYTPKPNYAYMDMAQGLTKYCDTKGADRGGIYIQTDKLKGHFRVSKNNLVKIENGKSEVIDTHKIVELSIEVKAAKTSLLLGESVDIIVKSTGGEVVKDATFTSSHAPEFVTLSTHGVITSSSGTVCTVKAIKKGTSDILVTVKDLSNTLTTTVKIRTDAIKVLPETAKIDLTKEVTLTAITSNDNKDVTWTSAESPATVTITAADNKCVVKGVKAGVANVVAKCAIAEIDYTDTSVVTVEAGATTTTSDDPDTSIDVKVKSDAREKSGIEISGSGYAVITVTNNNLAITTDKKQWLYNDKDGIRPNPAENLGTPIDNCFMNERLIDITPDPVTKITYIVQHVAGQDDVIKTLSYGTSDARADVINAIGYLTGNRVIVFNRFSCEIFRDDGNESPTKQFTLGREESRAIDGGLISTNCKTPFMGTWAVIGGKKNQSPNVMVIGNGAMSPIGTSEIQIVLSEYKQSDFDAAWLESRSQDGHEILICQLPKHTLQYDAVTKQWSILKTGLNNDVWRASHGVYDPVESKWIYGDKLISNLGYLDKSTFAQYDEEQEAILYTPIIPMYNQIISQLQIRMLAGRYPQGFTQRAWLSTTTAGGMTYGNEDQREVAAGLSYGNRFLWRGLGMVNNEMSYKLRIVSKYPTAIGESMELT